MKTDNLYDLETASLRQGAEAKIFDCLYLGRPAVIKERLEKKFRHPILDQRLRSQRFRAELRGLRKAAEIGVNSPAVYFVDRDAFGVIIQRIPGPSSNEWVEERRRKDAENFLKITSQFAKDLGTDIAKMHHAGLIHGDLTTSNVLLKDGDASQIYFIDFGLSSLGKVSPEDKAVDLYVLERAIQASHINCDHLMQLIIEGYKKFDAKQGEAVYKKLEEVRLRGRKRDMAG
ncbi:unnamed protein product, partial [Mesorhabditis spiculigera]